MNLIKARKHTKNKILSKHSGDRKPCQFDLGALSTLENINTSFYHDTHNKPLVVCHLHHAVPCAFDIFQSTNSFFLKNIQELPLFEDSLTLSRFRCFLLLFTSTMAFTCCFIVCFHTAFIVSLRARAKFFQCLHSQHSCQHLSQCVAGG